MPALAVATVVALAEGVRIYHLDAERFQTRRLLLRRCAGAGLAADRLAVPVALLGEHGHHVVLGEHVVVFAHERHGLEVQVHGVHRHDLRAAHVGLGLVLGDVGTDGGVGDRDSQREHRLDAAPALGLGQLLAVVVLRVEDLRDPGVVPAVHHVGVGLNESERPHGCGAAVSHDELVGLAIGHHDERRDLAVHLDAAGEPGHVSQLLAVLVAALDALGERDSRRFHDFDLLVGSARPLWAALVARALDGVREACQGRKRNPEGPEFSEGFERGIALQKSFRGPCAPPGSRPSIRTSRPPGARGRACGGRMATEEAAPLRRCSAFGNAWFLGDDGSRRMEIWKKRKRHTPLGA